MATIVDELILRFSLDPRQFNQGQQQVINQLQQLTQTARKSGGEVEESARKMADGFEKVTKEVLGLGAAFLGVSGLKQLVAGTIQTAAGLDIMTKAFNLNTEAMNRWQNVGRQFQVPVGVTQAAITNIASLQQQLRQGKVTPEALGAPSLWALAQITTSELANLDTYELLQRVAKGTREHPKDAAGLLAGTPFAPIMPTLMQPDLTDRLSKAETITKDMADNAERLHKAFIETVEEVEKFTNKQILGNAATLQFMNILTAIQAAAQGDLSVAKYVLGDIARQGQETEGGIMTAIRKSIYMPNMLKWAKGELQSVYQSGNYNRTPFEGPGRFPSELPPDYVPPPLPRRGRPNVGSYTSAEIDADIERNLTGSRGTGRWIAPYLGIPVRPGNAPEGFTRETNTTNHNTRTIGPINVYTQGGDPFAIGEAVRNAINVHENAGGAQ